MLTILKNTLAVVIGVIAGGVANMALILAGPHVIPTPAGVDVTNTESLQASVHLLGPEHFVFPFLAHALGTLVGALVAYRIATSHRSALAYVVGVVSLAGGISASVMIPAPLWFKTLDLVVAYLPMAWCAVLLGRRMTAEATVEHG